MFLIQRDIFVWDALILILLASGLCMGIIWLLHKGEGPRWQRRLLGTFGVLGLLGFCITFYGSFIEPRLIIPTEYTVPLPIRESLRIVLLGDFHVGPYKGASYVQRVVEEANKQNPDLIFLLGDFIYTESAKVEDLTPLKNLHASIGVFAVLGNHDMGFYLKPLGGQKYDRSKEVADTLKSLGIRMLRNTRQIVRVGDDRLAIAGVDDILIGRGNVEEALEGLTADTPTILLAHNPDVALTNARTKVDMIVSAHTHGGQIYIPGIGPLGIMPVKLGKNYMHGVFDTKARAKLVITRGVGESSPRARLFTWPEVMVIKTQPTMHESAF